MKQRWLLLMLVTSLVGCAPWTQVGGKLVDDSLKVQADLPAGWMRSNTIQDALLITRDGVLFQYITVQRIQIDKSLPNTKKKFANHMLPQEVAEVELDNARSNPNVTHFELIENVPVDVDRQPGFKLVYTYRTKEGLKFKRVHYGFLLGEWVYRIQYQAPEQYYFDRDLSVFEQVRTSLRFSTKV